jgi:hypothetical protein
MLTSQHLIVHAVMINKRAGHSEWVDQLFLDKGAAELYSQSLAEKLGEPYKNKEVTISIESFIVNDLQDTRQPEAKGA